MHEELLSNLHSAREKLGNRQQISINENKYLFKLVQYAIDEEKSWRNALNLLSIQKKMYLRKKINEDEYQWFLAYLDGLLIHADCYLDKIRGHSHD